MKLEGFQFLVPWHEAQLTEPTGMWSLFLPVAPLPVWQVVQLVAALKLAWSTLPADQVVVLWQVSQDVWPVCLESLGRMLAWQVLHCALTVTLVCSLAGVHATVEDLLAQALGHVLVQGAGGERATLG